MVTPTTSLGSMSEVNCRRWKSERTLRARACARVVLPTPGTSSISRCPRASREASDRRSTSAFPRIASPSADSISPNRERATEPSTALRWSIYCHDIEVSAHNSFTNFRYAVPMVTAAGTTRVLIVDDDVKLCRLLKDYLDPFGFDLTFAHAGPEGL